jgi:hypothetical protein
MRIKLDKILIYAFLEICMLSKSMPPLGTFVTHNYTLELVLLMHRWLGFLWKEHLHLRKLYFLLFTYLHTLTKKSKTIAISIIFPLKLANQYLQLLEGSTTFSILKGTTIDLLYLEVISHLFTICRLCMWRWAYFNHFVMWIRELIYKIIIKLLLVLEQAASSSQAQLNFAHFMFHHTVREFSGY